MLKKELDISNLNISSGYLQIVGVIIICVCAVLNFPNLPSSMSYAVKKEKQKT